MTRSLLLASLDAGQQPLKRTSSAGGGASWSSYVDQRGPDECWVWTSGTDGRGYGIGWNRETKRYGRAHRIAYVMAHPTEGIDGLDIHHRCGNRLCCNPAHLEALDKLEHSRRHADTERCPHGHDFTAENTILRQRSGGRVHRACRTCSSAQSRRYREKNAESIRAKDRARKRGVSAPDGRTVT